MSNIINPPALKEWIKTYITMTHYLKLLPAIVFLSFGSMAQEKAQTGSSSIGVQFSPDYTYRVLTGEQHQVDFRNEHEQGDFGFTTGLAYQYEFANHLMILTGVEYSQKNVSWKQAWIPPTISLNSSPLAAGQEQYRFNTVDVPLRVGYSGNIGKRIKLFGTLGTSVNMMISETWLRPAANEPSNNLTIKQVNKDRLGSLNFSAIASIGMDIALANKLSLRLEPTYRQSFFAVKRSGITGTVNEHPFSAGLNTGLFYRF